MVSKKKKKQNVFKAYFANFGIKQICDFLMIIGAIVTFVGVFTSNVVVVIGLGIYILACLIAIARMGMVMKNNSSKKKSPQYKNAFVNLIIMSVILSLAIFGLIYTILL